MEIYRKDLNTDLSYLDIFLKNHCEPVVAVVAAPEQVEEVKEEQVEEPQEEPTPAAEEETKEETTQPEPEPHHRESEEIAQNNEQHLSE